MGKKNQEDSGSKIDPTLWMVTFGDLLMLLLTFFVMLLSMKAMDTKALKSIFSIFEGGVGVMEFSNLTAIKPVSEESPVGLQRGALAVLQALNARVDRLFAENQKSEIEGLGSLQGLLGLRENGDAMLGSLESLKDVMDISEDERGVVITVESGVLFEPGMARLKSHIYPLLDTIAKVIAVVTNEILVMGHTDDRPVRGGQFQSNWELSLHRALHVRQYLVEANEIAADRVFAGGYGDRRPRYTNQTEEGRGRNRRVEIVLRKAVELI